MINQVRQFIFGYRAVERDCVPVPLAEVVARGDRGIPAAQPGREIRVASEADAAGAGPSVTNANILPARSLEPPWSRPGNTMVRLCGSVRARASKAGLPGRAGRR
jgi:hypothetical protein